MLNHQRGFKSKESKSSSSKGSKSQPKSSGKSAQAEEPVFETADTEMPLNQREAPMINPAPPQTWISKINKARKPLLTFDELVSTLINFSAYVLNNLKIKNLTQEHLAVIDRLDWTIPKGQKYPFDLSKPLPLIENQGCQVVPTNYFFNNEHEYLKGGSLSRKYTTSTTKTKAAKYDTIESIEDMVPSYASNRGSKHDVFSIKRIIAVTYVKVMKWYDYGYLEEIVVRREDQQLYKFKEGDFPRFNLNPQGIIYLDKFKRKRLMRSDELYNFCAGTLTSARKVLHDIASSLEIADDEEPIDDQPLLADASPTALSPGYVADSDPLEEDPEEDLEKDPSQYLVVVVVVDDDDDNEEEEEEASEEDEEEEHLASADSTTLPPVDLVPLAKDIEAFETDESAPIPLSPRLCRAKISKRARFTAPTGRFVVRESSLAATRQTVHTLAHRVDYGFIVNVDTSIRASESIAMTAVGERGDFRSMASSYERKAADAPRAWVHFESLIQVMKAHIRALQRDVDVLQRQRIRDEDRLTIHI
uniref:Uncharacterized protein n=1 Tax=Tanacetum cinerariifolium TaxID=118510 RepID=A0A6L2JF42_TANCI|nr:hypothetical protein [Tanacetum cinerariifolium]